MKTKLFFLSLIVANLIGLKLPANFDLIGEWRHNIEKKMFGDQPAPKWYQNITARALRQMNYKGTTPVLKLDNFDPHVKGLTTATGIWLQTYPTIEHEYPSEVTPYFLRLVKAQKTFIAYHEAAHKALSHSEKTQNFEQKMIAGTVVGQLAALGNLAYALPHIDDFPTFFVYSLPVLGITILSRSIMLAYSRLQEREADKLAAETLCKNNKSFVVKLRYAMNLYSFRPYYMNLFNTHPTEMQTKQDLKEVLEKYTGCKTMPDLKGVLEEHKAQLNKLNKPFFKIFNENFNIFY